MEITDNYKGERKHIVMHLMGINYSTKMVRPIDLA